MRSSAERAFDPTAVPGHKSAHPSSLQTLYANAVTDRSGIETEPLAIQILIESQEYFSTTCTSTVSYRTKLEHRHL